jgi:phosphate transport system substrate-binding protein
MNPIRISLATLALACVALAPQASPTAPASGTASQPAQAPAAPPAAITPGITGSAALQGWYTPEISDAIARFPEFLAKTPPFEGTLRIVGSNSMASLLTNLGRAYESIYPGVKIAVKAGGSAKGIQALKSGECDMASVSRALTESEVSEIETATGMKVFQVSIALDATCVYVNVDNPLPGINREQLNGIFSITHSLTKDPIIRWNDLDKKSPLGEQFMPIYVLPDSHGTMRTLFDFAMPGEQLTTIMRFTEPGASSVVNACCAYPTALGISGYSNRQPRARAVPVAEGAGKPSVAPSFRSIRDRSYPMWRPLNLVVLAKDADQVPAMSLDFLRFAWSEAGQDACAILGMVVVDIDRAPELLKDSVQRRFTENAVAR